MVRNRKHRNYFGIVVEIITSSSSPPFQHCSLHDEVKGNVFFFSSSQYYEKIFQSPS